MPNPSKRQLIIAAMASRLEAIEQRSGFATDAGRCLHLNEVPKFGPDDPDIGIVLFTAEDSPGTHQGDRLAITLPFDIQAVARAGAEDAWLWIEDMVADVKRAIELEDRLLGNLLASYLIRRPTRVLEKKDGSLAVGMVITYLAIYQERWGQP